MKTSDEILAEVKAVFKTRWKSRDGDKVPDNEDLALGNDAVKIEGAVLYADLVDSTTLVDGFKDWFAAEIYKTYLAAASHVIRNNAGEITAFDGDRVMAVFLGNSKNTRAAKTALQIVWIVRQLNDALKAQYPNTTYNIAQAIGIDSSALFVARTGIRNSNDLVWVGRAANYAAKLCALSSDGYPIHVTNDVHSMLNESSKFGGSPRRNMWEKSSWEEKGLTVYRSDWYWEF